MHAGVNRRLAKLEETLTPVSDWDPYWAEHKRRWLMALKQIGELVPADMEAEVETHLRKYVNDNDPQWWNNSGGAWDWHRSLVWCHSAIPDGMTIDAGRATLRRFMRLGSRMTGTCYSCGLCSPGPAMDTDWPTYPQIPCEHCHSKDILLLYVQHRRPVPPWRDDWPNRFRPIEYRH